MSKIPDSTNFVPQPLAHSNVPASSHSSHQPVIPTVEEQAYENLRLVMIASILLTAGRILRHPDLVAEEIHPDSSSFCPVQTSLAPSSSSSPSELLVDLEVVSSAAASSASVVPSIYSIPLPSVCNSMPTYYDETIDMVPMGINNIPRPCGKPFYLIRAYDSEEQCVDSLFHLMRGNVNLVVLDHFSVMINCLSLTKSLNKKQREYLRLKMGGRFPYRRIPSIHHLIQTQYVEGKLKIDNIGRLLGEVLSVIPETLEDMFESYEYMCSITPKLAGGPPMLVVHRRLFSAHATMMIEHLHSVDMDDSRRALTSIHLQRKLMGLERSNWDFIQLTRALAAMIANHKEEDPDRYLIETHQMTRECDREAARMISSTIRLCYQVDRFLRKS